MKKTLLFACLCFIVSCKDSKPAESTHHQENNTVRAVPDCACSDDMINYDEVDDKDKAAWLKKYGKLICPVVLNGNAERVHRLETAPAQDANTTDVTVTWGEIKALIQDHIYDRYIKATVDSVSGSVTAITPVTDYEENGFCFSPPLFRGIDAAMQGLADTDTLRFYSTTLSSKKIVAIEVIKAGNTAVYYDYSDHPDKNKTATKKSPL